MKRVAFPFAIALLLVSCGAGEIVTTSTVPATTAPPADAAAQMENLAAARRLWREAPVDYTVSVGGETLAVRGAEVVSLGGRGTTTVDDMFATIEKSIVGGAVVNVDYDPDLGFPSRVVIDSEGDGFVDIDLTFSDLQAMPIVESLEQLLEARATWDAQEIDTYRYIFRADCTCPDGGTFDVEVRNGKVTRFVPLDEAAGSSSLTPTSLEDAFEDLQEWFTNSAELIDEGLLAVNVRMDPALGYPRWFHVEGTGLGDDAFGDRFTIVVTIDLVMPYVPIDDEEPDTDPPTEDEQALKRARALWEDGALEDYSYLFTLHCECPLSVSGPFKVTVLSGQLVSAVHQGEPGGPQPDVVLIEDLLETIAAVVVAGIDVDVTYDDLLGFPTLAILDVEAVAVDGGLAFSVSEFKLLDGRGRLAGTVLAGPQCPVQQDPPRPGCEDEAVTVVLTVRDTLGRGFEAFVEVVEGSFTVPLPAGHYVVEAPPLEMYLGTPEPVTATIEPGGLTEIELYYDTGIR